MSQIVVDRFVNLKATTMRKDLVTKFRSVEAVDRLISLSVLDRINNDGDLLPLALGFECSNRPEALENAKTSLTMVLHVLQNLYEVMPPRRQVTHTEILVQARKMYAGISPEVIEIGLYLVKEFPVLESYGSSSGQSPRGTIPTAEWVVIHERIVTLNADAAWDDHIKQRNIILETNTRVSEPKVATSALQEGRKNAGATIAVSASPVKAERNWLPEGWMVVDALPEGGQGWTYRVKRTGDANQTFYVLKRLKNRNRLARFQREIEALKKLAHPNILKIIESPQGQPIYIAEYCERGDLTRVDLSAKTLLARVRLYREICDAIAAAHSANIIHRDLKPQNILIRGDGSVAVGDFGLCLDLGDLDNRPTSTSEAVGPRHYIAPELEDGRDENPKPSSDCYSLGKVLYFILGGRSFARERHKEGDYDLRSANGDPHLHFVYELLEKTIVVNPRDRYANAGELVNAVDDVILKIERDAHVLDMRLPQHCMYCRTGTYQIRLYTAGKPPSFSDIRIGDAFSFWGNNYMDQKNWMVLVCNNCGNAQMFRPDLAGHGSWKGLK
jgi:hypothetical protein